MNYNKYSADQLFTGEEMVNKVLITNQKGVVQDLVDRSDAGEDVQQLNGILCPGFINSHCHLELSHMKGLIPEKTGLVEFVLQILKLRHFPKDEVLKAIAQAEDEMWRNGIVAVGDISNTTDTFDQKKLQRIKYYNFIEILGFNPLEAKQRFEEAQKVYERFMGLQPSSFSSLVPHASYTVSPALFEIINEHAASKTISIHNQETDEEDLFFEVGKSDFIRMYERLNIDISYYQPTYKKSVPSYLPFLFRPKNILFVHNTSTKEDDIRFIQESGNQQQFFFCLCINANLYIENRVPPVDLLRNNHCNIVLGTDSLASNWSLNILDEIKTIISHFPAIPPKEILQWATLNGAKALQMDELLGSFEKGKQPGVNLIANDFSSVRRLI